MDEAESSDARSARGGREPSGTPSFRERLFGAPAPPGVDGGPSENLGTTEIRSRLVLLVCLMATGAFPVAMLVARSTVSRQISYGFLVWNLFLAGLPVILGIVVETAWRHHRRTLGAVFWVAWLLLFPNSPYLVTDLIHLDHRPPTPLWFDALILASAAIAGLLAGFVSLHLVQAAVARRLGGAWGWVMAVLVLGLSGFGVYLGRFARLNSWDVLTRPRSLLYDINSSVIVDGTPRAVIVTALFASFLIVTYVTIEMLTRIGRGEPYPRAGTSAGS